MPAPVYSSDNTSSDETSDDPWLLSSRWSRFLKAGGFMARSALGATGASLALVLLSYVVVPDAPRPAASGMAASASSAPPNTGIQNNSIQYVGDMRQSDRPCEEQTWPYIAAHCLKPAPAQSADSGKAAVSRQNTNEARADAPAPTTPVSPSKPASPVLGDKVAGANEATEKAVGNAATPVAEPQPSMADTRPAAVRQSVRDHAQRKRPRPAMAARAGEAGDARAEARHAYAAERNPLPVMRRWVEADTTFRARAARAGSW